MEDLSLILSVNPSSNKTDLYKIIIITKQQANRKKSRFGRNSLSWQMLGTYWFRMLSDLPAQASTLHANLPDSKPCAFLLLIVLAMDWVQFRCLISPHVLKFNSHFKNLES